MRRLDVGASALAVVVVTAFAPPCAGQGCPNPIVCENQLPGNPKSEWQIDAGSTDEALEGFADRMSYLPGETVNFKVSTDATSYRIEIFRLGFYSGSGARRVATIQPAVPVPQSQPNCVHDTASDPDINLIDCGNWAVSASWPVPGSAVSGVYVAKLIRQDSSANKGNHIFFVVRSASSSRQVVVQISDTTWQAYNWWGDRNVPGRPRYSLYYGPGGVSGGFSTRARKVSYNRPFAQTHLHAPEIGGNDVFLVEHAMIRWLEKHGYDVAYVSGSDTPAVDFTSAKVFLAMGHDEYWSGEQRANLESARDAGLNLAFFTANEVFWKTRWEADVKGTPRRTLVTYKEPGAPVPTPDPSPIWTGLWRDMGHEVTDPVKPENFLTGTAWAAMSLGAERFRVSADEGRLRLWRHTPLADLPAGEVATLTMPLGYEWDEDWDNGHRPHGLVRLSTSTHFLHQGYVRDSLPAVGVPLGPGVAVHHLTLYRAPSGALVFGAGSFGVIMGLDNDNVHRQIFCPGPLCPCPEPVPNVHDCTDRPFQQAVVNLLADMGVQPGSLQDPLHPADPSTDHTGPTVPGLSLPATILANTTLTIEGTAADSAGGQVAGVEVSVDNGQTWRAATRRTGSGYPWRFNWTPGPTDGDPAQVKVRAMDDSGNIGALDVHSVGVTPNQKPTIVIHAAGTGAGEPVGGAYPEMELIFKSLTAPPVVRTFSDVQGNVAKGEFERFGYSQNMALPSIKNIKVRFANEAPANAFGEDRNLYIQKLTINGADKVPLVDTVGFYTPSCAGSPPCNAFRLKFLNFWGPHDALRSYGMAGDIPIAGDWDDDGDDLDTVGVFRNGWFFLTNDYVTDNQSFAFGQAGDTPVAGDWDGNGIDSVGVFGVHLGAQASFHLRTEAGNEVAFAFGQVGDIPVAGDWDGDGTDTIGVFRDGWFYLRNSNSEGPPEIVFQYGQAGDKPVTGDWDWDGADGVGVLRWSPDERTPTVFLRNALTTGPPEQTFRAGASGDHIVAGHWKR